MIRCIALILAVGLFAASAQAQPVRTLDAFVTEANISINGGQHMF